MGFSRYIKAILLSILLGTFISSLAMFRYYDDAILKLRAEQSYLDALVLSIQSHLQVVQAQVDALTAKTNKDGKR